MEKSLLVLSPFGWGAEFFQFHKRVCFDLADIGWKVLWISAPLSPRHEKRSWIRNLLRWELSLESGIWHARLWRLPWARRLTSGKMSTALSVRQIRRLLERLAIMKPAILVFTPTEHPLIRMIPHSLAAYWVGDEVIAPGKEKMLAAAELVLAVSKTAFEQNQPHCSGRIVEMPTGVPLDLFGRAPPNAVPRLGPLNQRRPIIGYVGGITAKRLDLGLLEKVAQESPLCSFVLVGTIDADATEEIRRMPENVHPLGHKPYEEIPRYIRAFDVCIIPYLVNRFNEGCNPTKLYEYFALGKPVVATPIPAIEEFRRLLWVARDHREFTSSLKEALDEDQDSEKKEGRIAIAKTHSSRKIAEDISSIMAEVADSIHAGDSSA